MPPSTQTKVRPPAMRLRRHHPVQGHPGPADDRAARFEGDLRAWEAVARAGVVERVVEGGGQDRQVHSGSPVR